MGLKELFKIYNQLRKKSGCLIITKLEYGAMVTRYGDFTNEDINNYTSGFNNA